MQYGNAGDGSGLVGEAAASIRALKVSFFGDDRVPECVVPYVGAHSRRGWGVQLHGVRNAWVAAVAVRKVPSVSKQGNR